MKKYILHFDIPEVGNRLMMLLILWMISGWLSIDPMMRQKFKI